MKNKLKIVSVFSLAISFFCIQCSSSNDRIEDHVSKDVHSIEIDIDTIDSDYAFVAPSPIQIASIIQKAEMNFVDGITNSIENVTNYTTIFHQSINFGVYASDIAYCVNNEKYDEAGNYMKVIKDLSNKIGLETVFQSSNLIQRFEDNIGNQDSIMELLIYIRATKKTFK